MKATSYSNMLQSSGGFKAPNKGVPLRSSGSRPSLVVTGAINPPPRHNSQPAMRPLAPSDDYRSVIQKTNGSSVQKPPAPLNSNSSNGSTPLNGNIQRPQPIPMVYRGPPTPPASSSSPSHNGVAKISTSNGTTTKPVVYRNNNKNNGTSSSRRNGTASMNSFSEAFANSTNNTTFQRSMMVAGFDEDPADFPTDYKYSWASDDYSELKRSIDTWSFVLTLRARLWLQEQPWSYVGGMTDEKKGARARSLAIWIRESLLQLGPTFIKLGQLFSTRSDLFPAEFTAELSKLQDRVPAFDSNKVNEIIIRELGAPPSELFATFDPTPIAAASLGQVHRATLFSGEQVVVKVQRPGLRRLFDIDLENLRKIAEQIDRGDDATRDFKGIYQECATILYQEIDYINEGRSADKFRRCFSSTDYVRVPRVYWQRSSTAVLTMEYMPGIKITDIKSITANGLDGPSIAKACTESYLEQILTYGFFHADPHPGNIAVDPQGRLIYYDFGMMGTIQGGIRERLLDLFYGIAKKDVDAVLQNLIALGIIVPSTDTLSVRRALAYFVDNIGRQAEQQETVSAIGEDLFAIAIDSPFRFPATFTFVLRAFATLEGIGKALDPEFAFAKIAAPYAQELLDLQSSQQAGVFVLGQLQQQAADLGQATAAMPLRVARIEKTINMMESGDLKLRVRVLESERAARRQGVMQVVTVNTVASVGFMNAGVQLALAGQNSAAGALLVLSGVFGGLVLYGMRRVKRLDRFEDGIKGKATFPPEAANKKKK